MDCQLSWGSTGGRPVYLAIGIDCDGANQVPGLGRLGGRGVLAKAWLTAPLELKPRVGEVCIVCCDCEDDQAPSWAASRPSLGGYNGDSRNGAWNVDASVPANKDGVVNLRLIFLPSADLTVAARSAAFFADDVPGLPDTPPDFAGSDAEVAAGMVLMDSPFEPTKATFIDLTCWRYKA